MAKKGAKNTWSANCHLLTPDMLPPVVPLPRPKKQQGLDMEVTRETRHGLTRNWKKLGIATNTFFNFFHSHLDPATLKLMYKL